MSDYGDMNEMGYRVRWWIRAAKMAVYLIAAFGLGLLSGWITSN